MSTDREQLIEMRKSILLSRMGSKSEHEKKRLDIDLPFMEFKDHEDFMSYVDDRYPLSTETRVKEATEEEIDEVFAYMGVPPSAKDSRSAEEKEIDEIFKYL